MDRFEPLNATVLWTVAGDGSTEPNLNFSFHQKEKCSKSGRYLQNKKDILSDVLFIFENRGGQI